MGGKASSRMPFIHRKVALKLHADDFSKTLMSLPQTTWHHITEGHNSVTQIHILTDAEILILGV
jgi:hypothetical protein